MVHSVGVALLPLVGLLLANVSAVDAQITYIYGKQSWWTTSDTIQFLGDGNAGCPATRCEQWHEDCVLDNGFVFREVYDVDTQECEFDTTLTCYVAGVNCCFWAIGCTGQDIADVCAEPCAEVKENCPPDCYCRSIWRIRGFNVGPGDDEDPTGCYEIELVCETSEQCLGLKEELPCTTIYTHCQE